MSSVMIDGREFVPADELDVAPSETQIVVGQRGWVFVGRVSDDGDDHVIRDAKNIRKWGTSKGLGELVNGPLPDTKHDDYGTVRVPKLGVIARIDVAEGAWS